MCLTTSILQTTWRWQSDWESSHTSAQRRAVILRRKVLQVLPLHPHWLAHLNQVTLSLENWVFLVCLFLLNDFCLALSLCIRLLFCLLISRCITVNISVKLQDSHVMYRWYFCAYLCDDILSCHFPSLQPPPVRCHPEMNQ